VLAALTNVLFAALAVADADLLKLALVISADNLSGASPVRYLSLIYRV
jgi:hypothetical protein